MHRIVHPRFAIARRKGFLDSVLLDHVEIQIAGIDPILGQWGK